MKPGLHRLPLCPFPPVPWWGAAMSGGARLDGLEHYPKRTFRNRFTLMQSTGTLELSLPVEKRGGRPRSQDETMRITGEPDRKAWQAVRTAYGRAPFFEEMEEELEALFKNGPGSLGGWNRATMQWAATWLGISVPSDVTPAEYAESTETSMMSLMASAVVFSDVSWSHVWHDRQPHIPFLSLGILDLILHLGPSAGTAIKPIPLSGSPRPGSRPE